MDADRAKRSDLPWGRRLIGSGPRSTFVLVMLTDPVQVYPECWHHAFRSPSVWDLQRPHKSLTSYAATHGLPCANVRQRVTVSGRALPFRERRYTRLGLTVAEAILDYLERHELFAGPAPAPTPSVGREP